MPLKKQTHTQKGSYIFHSRCLSSSFLKKQFTLIHTYRSYHTSIDPIPIPALVSMLSIFGSIGPPLPNTSALKFAPCITFTCPQIQGANHLWHWLKHHLPIFRPHTLALPAIASTSSPLSSISSCPFVRITLNHIYLLGSPPPIFPFLETLLYL